MSRFDDIGTGDGRWDESGSTEESTETDSKAKTAESNKRPACSCLAALIIKESLYRGKTIEIPSLGIRIEPKKSD